MTRSLASRLDRLEADITPIDDREAQAFADSVTTEELETSAAQGDDREPTARELAELRCMSTAALCRIIRPEIEHLRALRTLDDAPENRS